MLRPRPPSWPSAHICWKCQTQIARQHRKFCGIAPNRSAQNGIASLESPPPETHAFRRPQKYLIKSNTAPANGLSLLRNGQCFQAPRRTFHITQPHSQTPLSTSEAPNANFNPVLVQSKQQSPPIRDRLQKWQDEYGGPNEETLRAFERHPARGEISNDMARMTPADSDLQVRDNWEEEDDGEELNTLGMYLKPGDVVELFQSNREPILAVFVQQFEVQCQFFTVNGKWAHTTLADVRFAIPGCIDPSIIRPLIPYLPTKPDADIKGDLHVPLEVGAKVMTILQKMSNESEKIYRENAAVLDNAYTTLADQTRTRMMILKQIAKTLLGNSDSALIYSAPALLAVRKALLHNQFKFRADRRSQRLTNVFAIRPKADVEVIETVQDWVREFLDYQALNATRDSDAPLLDPKRHSKGAAYITQFVEKARRLISFSRKHRDPLPGATGPSKTRYPFTKTSSVLRTVWGEEFSSTDKQIINFLQAWILMVQFVGMPSLHSSCTSILHATRCYEDSIMHTETAQDMTTQTGHLFLQEIGVITPYENRTIYDEQLMLPTIRLSRNLELLNTKAEITRRNPDFYDSMADLRRDWGEMNVYCIDSTDAKEIDDGLSVSKVEGRESEYWVHVHIANPTAFFDKTHVLSGLAAHMTETVYLPERTFPMLPTWVTQNYFSLDRNRPVLTFSTRLDLSGTVLETKIQPGIIRKVTSLAPADLAEILGSEDQSDILRLVVGGDIPAAAQEPDRSRPNLTPAQHQELQNLNAVARALWEKRKEAGGISIQTQMAECRVFERSGIPGLGWAPPSIDRARFVHGDPVIEMTARRRRTASVIREHFDPKYLVEEMMLLACQTGAAWCAERSIPVIFRGTIENPYEMPLEKFKEEILKPCQAQTDTLPASVAFQYMQALGRSITHTSPLPHRIIGAKSYLRVTSPLRRFSDMISHWQIEAALRHEARTGKKFGPGDLENSVRPVLPFSQQQLQESIITLTPRERLISKTKISGNQFWATQAFMRAVLYNEAEVPKTFRVWIRRLREGFQAAQAMMTDWCLMVNVTKVSGMDFVVGDEWEVEIQSINTFRRSVHMYPIRLIQRETWSSP
ncbi:RNB-domain-containing protein, partial [Zopfia rhizophila CBS 207.26]